MRLCQKIGTTNDTNGNPRRLWIIYDTRKTRNHRPPWIAGVVEEGYAGAPAWLPKMELPSVEVAPKEYHDWKKIAKEEGVYIEQ